jgi:hypothetical protein
VPVDTLRACSSLLRAKLLPSTWRELGMGVGEVAFESLV